MTYFLSVWRGAEKKAERNENWIKNRFIWLIAGDDIAAVLASPGYSFDAMAGREFIQEKKFGRLYNFTLSQLKALFAGSLCQLTI
jgi:hypothetical protein